MISFQIRNKFPFLVLLFVVSVLVVAVRSNSRLEQKQEPDSKMKAEQPTALVEKTDRNKTESAAYTDDRRLKSLGEEGKMTSEARRLKRDITFLTEDSFTVLPLVPEPPAVALLKHTVLA